MSAVRPPVKLDRSPSCAGNASLSGTERVGKDADHLHCVVEMAYTSDNVAACAQMVLDECMKTKKHLVYIDFTAIRDAAPATSKLISAHQAEA